jgi:protein-tyrosine phosphatase
MLRPGDEERSMRYLEWEACYNIRDIGGYARKDGGAIIRADNLYRLTPAGRAALLAYGVRTLIDLRFAEELAKIPSPFADGAAERNGLRYLNIPLLGDRSEAVEALFRDAPSVQARYCLALDYAGASFARVITAVADAPTGGVLVHCHAGRDRTGTVVALLLALVGVPPEIIVEDYALSDRYLQPLNEEFMQSMPGPREREKFAYELMITRPTMRGFLSYLDDKYGGAEAYLRTQGVSEERLERIRKRLVAK